MGKVMNNHESDKEHDPSDYADIVIKDMHEILTSHRNPWPAQYTRLKKLEFLDKMLDYLMEREMFEMCAGVQKMKEGILNEPRSISKRIKGR